MILLRFSRFQTGKSAFILPTFGVLKLRETIQGQEQELQTLRQQRKAVPSHVTLGDLPKEQRFQQFCRSRKHLVDTIKMVAYRAETALAMSLREIFVTEAEPLSR